MNSVASSVARSSREFVGSFRDDPLWIALSGFQFDDPQSAFSFTGRLRAEQLNWDAEYTQRVVNEYRRFLYLASRCKRAVTPSEAVDQVWHLNLVYSRLYRELCETVLGTFLHHGPTRGGRVESERYFDQYSYTLSEYQRIFGEHPPSDIWPTPQERFGADIELKWVDTGRYLILPRNVIRKLGIGLLLGAVAVGVAYLLLSVWT